MNGEVLPLFSQPVYVDTLALDDSMVQSVINTECEYVAADTIGNNGAQSNTQWLQEQPEIRNLVEEYLDHYVYNILGINRQRHQLVHQSSWVNKHVKGDKGDGHSHTNSMFSGCLYFKVPPNSGELRFHVGVDDGVDDGDNNDVDDGDDDGVDDDDNDNVEDGDDDGVDDDTIRYHMMPYYTI